MNKKGFTLIELLIVVAIIAILAAIAVPNFLEAQTRSKVARCKADMRTISIAINSYRIDVNKYPPGYCDPFIYGYPDNSTRDRRTYWMMTTPVAYLSSIPEDPFCPPNPSRPEQIHYFYNEYQNDVNFLKFTGKLPAGNPPVHAQQSTDPNYYNNIVGGGWTWMLYSTGPSKVEIGTPNAEDMIVDAVIGKLDTALNSLYDPTNGTNSRGRIMDSNKGFVVKMPM